MTEKRFEPIADKDGFVKYIRDNTQKRIGLLTFDEFIDVANALHEENTHLKKQLNCIMNSLQKELYNYGSLYD